LGDLCKIIKWVQLNRDDFPVNWKYPVLNWGINPSWYTDDYNRNENTIIISEWWNSCWYINFSESKFWCWGHCYSLENVNCNILYLYQALKFNEKEIMRLRVGSWLPNIQKKDIEKFSQYIPSLPEQQKIAEFLSGIDEKIEKVNQELENTEKFKKGLLQNMFV
jgi:type I restriction enzyme S subunit